ncbi:MAG: hypothetical protein Roseis2KO_02200 [Roseivirga sp.]
MDLVLSERVLGPFWPQKATTEVLEIELLNLSVELNGKIEIYISCSPEIPTDPQNAIGYN